MGFRSLNASISTINTESDTQILASNNVSCIGNSTYTGSSSDLLVLQKYRVVNRRIYKSWTHKYNTYENVNISSTLSKDEISKRDIKAYPFLA